MRSRFLPALALVVAALPAAAHNRASMSPNIASPETASSELSLSVEIAFPEIISTAPDTLPVFTCSQKLASGFFGRAAQPNIQRTLELGQESRLGDDFMHARYYNPNLGRFLSVDPARKSADPSEPQTWNRYSYAHNNPILKIDPDGQDALAVTYVGYKVATPFGRRALGHSGIIVSQGRSTRYYEFGRYDAAKRGLVRRPGSIPDFQLGKNGLPTRDSLKNVLQAVSTMSGQGKPVEGAYFVNDKAEKMIGYAQDRVEDSSKQGTYSLTGNNCATFCEDVLKAGGEKLDVSISNTPENVIQELQDAADFSVNYDPETKKIEVNCASSAKCPE